MANLPYLTGNEDKVLGIMKMYSRMGAYPLDATSVFNTKDDLLAYIAEAGSYAYPGQVVAVANGDITSATHDDDYSLYVIRSDRTVQEIGKNLTFATMDEATAFIASNKTGIRIGELITITDTVNDGYALYMVKDDYNLQRMSFDVSDVPDVTWANLQNKPTSAVTDIDDAVTKKHDHENKTALDKLNEANNKPTYASNELAYMSDLKWSNLSETPTTVGDYGITDVYTKTQSDGKYVPVTDVATSAEANKLLKLDENAKIPATILTGTIPIENLPHGAVERCVVVETDEERLALTSERVQSGDTVKVNGTGKMYFVIDDTKLTTEDAFTVYTAGTASNVDWSGVTSKPTTLLGYGITDAVASADVVTSAQANKILKLDENGNLPTSITGNADTVDGKHASDFVPATDVVTDAQANKLLKLDAEGKLPTSITGDAATVGGKQASDFVAATEVVTDAQANKLLKLDADGNLPTNVTGSAGSVAWTGVQNKPTTLSGYGITDAVGSADIVDVATPNKVLKLDANGELPTSITGNAATASKVAWTGVQNTPDTLAGYGITDAYTGTHIDETFVAKTEVTTTATPNKLLKLDADGNLPTNITGNAATATNVEWTGVQNKPTTVAGYGITDVYTKTQADTEYAKYVPTTEVVESAAANKILKLNAEGKIPVSVISGTIPLSQLPHGAVERCVVVDNDTARFKLTNLDIQTGDTVKVTSTGKMYFVVDDTKLGTEAGYEVYTAGTASNVAWSGVQNTPTTLSGYGITDAFTKEESNANFVAATDVVATAQANKVLKLNADAKLPADITGNAATATNVAWSGVQNTPVTLAGYGITDAYSMTQADSTFVAASEVVEAAVANKLLKLNADGKLPASITGTAGSVAWENVVGKPTSAAADIDDAVTKRHNHANMTQLNALGVNDEGKLTYNNDNVVAYMSDVAAAITIGGASTNPDDVPVGGLWFDTNVG